MTTKIEELGTCSGGPHSHDPKTPHVASSLCKDWRPESPFKFTEKQTRFAFIKEVCDLFDLTLLTDIAEPIEFKPRRSLLDEVPGEDGYRESDIDYVLNNIELCVEFLDNYKGQPQVTTVVAIGERVEPAAGLQGVILTKWFSKEDDLEAFCERNIEKFRAAAKACDEGAADPDTATWV